MILLGYIQLIFIIAITYYEYKKKSPIVFMWATLLVMFGIMHVISYMLPNYKYADTLDEASGFVILFCAFYIIVRVLSRKLIRPKKIVESNTFFSEERVLAIGKIVLVLSVTLYAYFVIRSSGSLFLVTKKNVYQTMAKGSKFFLLSTYLYYASAPLFLYCLIKKRKKDVVIIGALIIARSLLSSSRMDMVMLFAGAIAYIILRSNKRQMRTIIILGIMGIVALVAIYALRTFRYYYSFSTIGSIQLSKFVQYMVDFVKNDDGELGLRKTFYFFIQNGNNFSGFGTGDGYKRVLMFMIPSRLTGGLKPEDMCVVMGRAWKPGFSGIITYTLTPTLFGDCYANLGFFGFLLGGFWAGVATIADAIANRKNEIIRLMLWGLMAVEFIDIGRGSVYNPICHIWYCGLIIALLYSMRRFKVGIRVKFVIGGR